MFKLAKLLLATIVSTFATAAPLVPAELRDGVTANPGAIFASLKVSSLNNILQLMAPLLANEILQGKTLVKDVHKSIHGIGINLNFVNCTVVSSSFDHSI